eukprot:5291931-Prymnesium_polylepis.1
MFLASQRAGNLVKALRPATPRKPRWCHRADLHQQPLSSAPAVRQRAALLQCGERAPARPPQAC